MKTMKAVEVRQPRGPLHFVERDVPANHAAEVISSSATMH